MGTELVAKAGSTATKEAEISTPSVLWCGVLLFAVRVALKTRGLGRTLRWIQRRVETVPEATSVARDTLAAIEHAVATAGAFYPGRALCLEQSLTLYYYLRRVGVSVTFHLGVKPHPFEAHAWVEYEGEPVNDVLEHVQHFVPLASRLL
jgi:hypothetical protein